eukprot:m.300017 g.300017  ORF g.300017 m.300017 type:complete len:444 (-) comp16303_c0_seq7:6565-7896(-)
MAHGGDGHIHFPPPSPLLPVVGLATGEPRRVGVFWDYENVKIPKGTRGPQAVNRMREAIFARLPPKSRIEEMKLYADMTKSEGVVLEKPEGKSFQSLKSGIDLSGFTVVDCPTRGKKETLDKKIIVDCMKFGLQHPNIPTTVVLISGDGDYSYMLSILRNTGVTSLVIHKGLNAGTAHILIESCDVALHWELDVLVSATIPHIKEAPQLRSKSGGASAASPAVSSRPPPIGVKNTGSPKTGSPKTSRDPSCEEANDVMALYSEDELLEFAREGYASYKHISVHDVSRELLTSTAAGVVGWAALHLNGIICENLDATPAKSTPFAPEPGTPAADAININLAADFERDRQDAFQASLREGEDGAYDMVLALLSDRQGGDKSLWVLGSTLGESYYTKIGLKDKARYRAVMSKAVDHGYVETSDMTPPKGSPLPQFRLTDKGWARLE